ncbi:MAG: N-6 DNA methylase, partial [Caldilineaceae bacterium]|nr:N-6 DNA methylase [Caldilineaceae bacterium]
MRHFATESGKSKGQFYTPSEVSRILAKVIGINADTPQDATVYDPTCGSGSLLLKASDEAPRGLSIYGQEMDNATSALARMNMILHNNATAKIWKGNTISDPHWKENREGKDTSGKLKTFDFAVANPPFSNKNWTSGLNPQNDEFGRFEWGIPPEKNGDYTFLLHIIKSLKSTGKGAVILPHGVLFRGNAEARIRENLIKQGYIKGIIGLPANLFYGTGIPACIIVIDKEHAPVRTGIFMVDASKGFMKDGNKNRLREQDIHKIVDTFNRQIEIPRYSRMVPFEEIGDPKNDYNLNLPRYIDTTEPEDVHDINAHLRGGIPNDDIDALESYWQVMPSVREALFRPAQWPGYSRLNIPANEVKSAITDHSEFATFNESVNSLFGHWKDTNIQRLKGFAKADSPKTLVEIVSEDLLATFRSVPLIDPYDVYQHLMDQWSETMQDDCYLISADGWVAKTSRILETDKKGKTKDKGWTCELVPKSLTVARYFATEQAA